jgi:hypothetical protein
MGGREEIKLLYPTRSTSSSSQPCSLFFQHNYKVGGTTVLKSQIPQSGNFTLGEIQRSQSSSGQRITAFTFVRDPITRFISAIGQVSTLWMGLQTICNVRHLGYDKKQSIPLKKLLWNATIPVEDFVDCTLQTIMEEKSYLNIHLLPQTYNLYNQQGSGMYPSITIDILDITFIDSVLQGMGSPVAVSHNVASNKERSKVGKDSNDGINPFLKLSNATTIRSMLSKEQIQTICQIYKMDVDLLHVVGEVTKTKTICDDYNIIDDDHNIMMIDWW